ncbi:hypothetical protein Tco_0898480 [Tanacetum coccineum]
MEVQGVSKIELVISQVEIEESSCKDPSHKMQKEPGKPKEVLYSRFKDHSSYQDAIYKEISHEDEFEYMKLFEEEIEENRISQPDEKGMGGVCEWKTI